MLAQELMNYLKDFFSRKCIVQFKLIVREFTTMIYHIFIQFLLISEVFSLYDWLHSTRFHKIFTPSITYAHEPMQILGNFMTYIVRITILYTEILTRKVILLYFFQVLKMNKKGFILFKISV